MSPALPSAYSKGSLLICKSDADYDRAIATAGKSLICIDCYAEWCRPCKQIEPTIHRLAREYPDVVFIKVDVDSCTKTKAALRVMAMPTFIFMKEGKKRGEFMGASVDLLIKGLKNNGSVGMLDYCCSCTMM